MIHQSSDLPGVPASAVIWGRVCGSDGARVRVSGLAQLARIGDQLRIQLDGDREAMAEIVALDRAIAVGMLMGPANGLAAGQRACLEPMADPVPSAAWLGHVVDAFGRARSAEGTAAPATWPTGAPRGSTLRVAPPPGDLRRPLTAAMSTGVAALDTVLPLCRGQRIGIFAGSGVGKSMLLDAIARGADADVIVVGLIGERGREVAGFARGLLDGPNGDRTVIVAATSDQPALLKRRAALLAMACAEHFRDQGKHVLLLFDSVTRFAEAHREIALAAGEMASLRAFPPSTTAAVAQLCERAGPGIVGDQGGDVTAVFTVLVAGSDMEEPVADMLRGVLDGHVILDRAIAERGRFPAIDVRRSVSRSAPGAWNDAEGALCRRARSIIATYEDAAPLIRSGLYSPGSDAALDEAVRLYPEVDAFLGTTSLARPRAEAFRELAAILGGDPAR
ncbi:flagellum-specific ATP synthase FliI [Limibaculum sp. M0105]|uniref:Flagellum-specific ATP synthase FliI n=1 Tax=Thermohalobaculum xanthum TaxID=2753746 RepID=A0A8J7SAW4_9RHOB|nr:flagellum-specific ATP synthase FliI [Thermohalobaculum xanthum]MBK0398113.1 flagellum-specific ATP synthase FliI [Thermohalobaculum xanthum]